MIEMCAKSGRPIPPEYIAEKVQRADLLNAFYHLSQRRNDDYAPITDAQVMEYVVVRGSHGILNDKFVYLINRLDGRYLKAKSEKAKADMEAMKNKRH